MNKATRKTVAERDAEYAEAELRIYNNPKLTKASRELELQKARDRVYYTPPPCRLS